MKLYSYWRSGTSYRVRLALAFKGADAEIVPVNLLEGAHKNDAYLSKNAQGLVPALELDDGTVLSQSPAIIEYLEEVTTGPAL
ncbi:MAG: glutathione S-transferase N-terminal domain-containing protein, partial [Parvularcula sp.]|nr:glutathione S-transferase N-terminal domain-containing protein [Parvularcula sp.]